MVEPGEPVLRPHEAGASAVEERTATAAGEPAPAPTHPELRAQIEARNRDLEQAYARGDMKAVAAIYADDALMLSPGGRRWEGRAEIDEYWSRLRDPIEWTLEVREVEGNEGLAVERGRSTLVYGRPEPHRSVVEFMLVWVREVPGDPSTPWRIAVDAYW